DARCLLPLAYQATVYGFRVGFVHCKCSAKWRFGRYITVFLEAAALLATFTQPYPPALH
ncbi:MAG: hypothetical protein ACJAUL_000729, partial [Paraglaciecola sp.]